MYFNLLDMKKRDKVIYWVATIWLALGMTSAGVIQLIQLQEEVVIIEALGYPVYILPLLGVLKLLGVVVLLLPKLPLLKEWAYAGFFFNMLGALYSHIMMSAEAMELFGPTLLIILLILSWKFRPESKKIKMG